MPVPGSASARAATSSGNCRRQASLPRWSLTSASVIWMRPLAAATDSSPAPLRLSLTPAQGGINIGFVKRQGPVRDGPLFLPIRIGPVRHVVSQKRTEVACIPEAFKHDGLAYIPAYVMYRMPMNHA